MPVLIKPIVRGHAVSDREKRKKRIRLTTVSMLHYVRLVYRSALLVP